MTTLCIENMHCGACVRRVSAALNALPGTIVHEVQIGMARIESSATTDQILTAVGKTGFPAHLEGV